MKKCSKCQQHKENFYFYKDSTKKDGITSYCKVCAKEKRKARYINNTEEEKRAFKKHHKENKDIYKNNSLKNLYGIDLNTHNLMRQQQLFSCLICKTHEQDLARGLFVDHCHETKKVRGLLCQHCNTLLGMAKDNILILQEAIKYLTRTN